MKKKKLKNKILAPEPFRILDLQLQLEKLEIEWEEAKSRYSSDDGTVQDVDDVLRLTVEKIKILSELSSHTNEA